MAVVVRRVRSDEWRALRRLRLRALQDAPDAFGSTYRGESLSHDTTWIDRAEDLADGGSSFGAVAVDEQDAWVGLAIGAAHRDHPGEAGLFAMWVAPDARRTGVGRVLVERVIGWARSEGYPVLRLLVTETNDGAVRLYERAGFADEGRRLPLRAGSAITTISMTMDLST